MYGKDGSKKVVTSYIYIDLSGDMTDIKNTRSMTFYINIFLVSWNSYEQKIMALSSYESEFMVTTMLACQAVWLRSLLGDLTKQKLKLVKLFIHNKSTLTLINTHVR